jgi:hypothetical protein
MKRNDRRADAHMNVFIATAKCRSWRSSVCALAASMLALHVVTACRAQQSDTELATKLSNPVASLISVPFQYNWDHDFGSDREGHKSYLKIQPVIPAKLNSDWTLISRVIVPIVDQHIPFIGDGGRLWLSPDRSPGAAFSFSLPSDQRAN